MSKPNVYSMNNYRKEKLNLNKNNIGKIRQIFNLRIIISKKSDMKFPSKTLLVIGTVFITSIISVMYKSISKTKKV